MICYDYESSSGYPPKASLKLSLDTLGVTWNAPGLGTLCMVFGNLAATDDFYSTTNHRTEVFFCGRWRTVKYQRMDAAVVKRVNGPACVMLRDLQQGDKVLVGASSVRVHPPEVGGGTVTLRIHE